MASYAANNSATKPKAQTQATQTQSKAETSADGLPIIKGESALTMDYDTGEIIYCKDADSKRYPASTTKLLTGLILAENKTPTDQLEYTKSAKEQPEYSLNINYMHNTMQPGDTVSADDIMKGLLLFSGNDTAYVIADNISGNATAFADLMNKRAKELGANNSNFITPNGLHNDNHYTTAYDLSLILKAAFNNDWERKTMELEKAPITLKNSKIILENRNITLNKNGNIAGKTGTTVPAGGCLTTVYERDGRKILGIVLKSSQIDNADMTKFNDMDSIMDYSYAATKSTYKSSGEDVGTADVKYKSFGFFGPTKTISMPIKLTQDVTYYKNTINDDESKITYTGTDSSAWSLLSNKNIKLTYATRNHTEEVTGMVNISLGAIFKDNIILYIATLVVLAIIITLVLLIKTMVSNAKRKNRRYSNNSRRKRR
jgi:D-alanyl-D-alanine carboxypeptidase